MKQTLLLLFISFFSFSMMGQNKLHIPESLKKSVIKPTPTLELSTPQAGPIGKPAPNPYADLKGESTEVQIGNTFYDLQTNSSIQNRLNLLPSGEWAASWIFSLEETAHSDRGTGYTSTTGGVWGDAPITRLESLRCGWPSLTNNTAGKEIALSHATATTPYSLNIMSRDAGETDWTETNYPGDQPLGMLWPRTAASGDYLHVIALSTPASFGGGPIDGIDGTILYYRSDDGGATFSIEEVQLPGLTSDFYANIGGDNYAIAADGATVAIAHFASFGDISVWKSTDNGDNWTKTIAADLPLDGYVTDAGYEFADVEAFYTEAAPDSLAIPATDGSGAIAIDFLGKVHIVAGFTYVMDDVLTDGNTSFFPGFGDLWYWNEDLGEDGATFLGDLTTAALDLNGNDSLDLAATIPQYGNGLISYPSLAVNDANDLILSFAAIQEDLLDITTTNMNFRHTIVVKSSDNGETWENMIDLSDDPYGVSELGPITEVVYGSLYPREVGGRMHMIYQRDFIPGLAVIGDNHSNSSGSSIHYVSFEADLVTSIEDEPTVSAFSVYPNPTTSSFAVGFDLVENAPVAIYVTNLLGQRMVKLFDGDVTAGSFQQTFAPELATGVYLLEVNAGDAIQTQKIVITQD